MLSSLRFTAEGTAVLAKTSESSPRYRPHIWPRSRAGRLALASFSGLLALAEPPAVYVIANRVEPRILEMPFLYLYLLVLYLAMTGVLVWVAKRGL